MLIFFLFLCFIVFVGIILWKTYSSVKKRQTKHYYLHNFKNYLYNRSRYDRIKQQYDNNNHIQCNNPIGYYDIDKGTDPPTLILYDHHNRFILLKLPYHPKKANNIVPFPQPIDADHNPIYNIYKKYHLQYDIILSPDTFTWSYILKKESINIEPLIHNHKKLKIKIHEPEPFYVTVPIYNQQIIWEKASI